MYVMYVIQFPEIKVVDEIYASNAIDITKADGELKDLIYDYMSLSAKIRDWDMGFVSLFLPKVIRNKIVDRLCKQLKDCGNKIDDLVRN